MKKRAALLISLLIFLVTALILRLTHYVFIPVFQSITGKRYLVGYLVGWVATMFLVFSASLVVYKLEGNPIDRKVFFTRYHLGKMNRQDGLWTLVIVIFAILSMAALTVTQKWLASMSLFAPHPAFPPDFVNIANLHPGILFEMPLKGKWWIVGVYLFSWLLNIFGEEFWYRGWMLPRQEMALGKYAWLANGLMFNFQHIYIPWTLLAMLPASLLVPYVVQRQQKTWISIFFHGLANIVLLIFLLKGVAGKIHRKVSFSNFLWRNLVSTLNVLKCAVLPKPHPSAVFRMLDGPSLENTNLLCLHYSKVDP